MIAKFRIFQSMMFRKSGEFDPSSRGVYSKASSFIVPTPSTLVGALASLYISSYVKAQNWVDEYRVTLNNAIFKGPFLKIGNMLYFDCNLERLLIPQQYLYNYVQIVNEIINAKSSREIEDINEKKKKLIEKIKKEGCVFKMQERVGIGLKVREEGGKIVDEERGKIYNVEYIEYADFRNKDILVEIYLDVINSGNVNVGKHYIKLGGEGRIVKLSIEESKLSIFDDLKNQLKIADEANALYISSPLLCETGISIKDIIKNDVKQEVEIYGSIDIIGAGYSLARKRRKPIYQVLLPGSMIFIKGRINSREIYNRGLGFAKELGYGTVIPVLLK
jgi:CRISPR-associated protein Cmr3